MWPQDRIYKATVSVAGKSTCQSFLLRTSSRVSASRSTKVIEEKSHHTGRSSGGPINFLSVLIPNEIRRAPADHKSSSAKQVCALSTLQDGWNKSSKGFVKSRRLLGLNRSKGLLPHGPHSHGTSQLPAFPLARQLIPVYLPWFPLQFIHNVFGPARGESKQDCTTLPRSFL